MRLPYAFGEEMGRMPLFLNLHIPRQQILEYCDGKKRVALAKTFVDVAIHNARLNIRYYHKQHNRDVFVRAVARWEE